ncbi:MAG TPA: hypothetical protein VLV86_02345 [Vicinamibacterales bacterium]|nr:hypothetical protein [Vicinamibacterales bacterium]
MRVSTTVVAFTVVAGLAACRPVLAQSLGDVAKQEEERRKDVKAPSKVYTDKDLSTPPSFASDGEKPSGGAASPAAASPGDASKEAANAPAKDEPVKDQKYWSGRHKELEAKVDRDKVLADAMQSRINGLTRDFSARDDPAQRAVIEADRKRALSEFDALQQSIKDDQKALADLDEEARKASVPPGWLR